MAGTFSRTSNIEKSTNIYRLHFRLSRPRPRVARIIRLTVDR